MRIYLYEIYKLITRKGFMFIFLFLFAVNLFLVIQSTERQFIDSIAYKTFYEDLSEINSDNLHEYLSEKKFEYTVYNDINTWGFINETKEHSDKALPYINKYSRSNDLTKYTSSLHTKLMLYKEALAHFEAVNNYDLYLEGIRARAEQMLSVSIYAKKGTFTHKNIMLTPTAYENLKGNKLTFDISKGVNFSTEQKTTDIIAIILVFIMSTSLILPEKDKDLYQIVRPTKKGRLQLISSKIFVSFTFCILIVALLYGSNILISAFKYGLGDLSRYIQSVHGFIGSILDMSVLQYLFTFAAVKLLTLTLVSAIIIIICIKSGSNIIVYLYTALLTGLFALLYTVIPATSIFSLFKHINIFSFLNTNEIFSDYYNINFFNVPLNIISTTFVALFLTIILTYGLSILTFVRLKNMTHTESRIKELINKIRIGRNKLTTSLFKYELYKLLIVNKGLIVIVSLIIIGTYTYNSYSIPYDEYDSVYKNYMLKLQGEVNATTDGYIKEEYEKYREIRERQNDLYAKYNKNEIDTMSFSLVSSSLQNDLRPEQVLISIEEKAEYIKLLEGLAAKPWLVYDTGYNQLTGITYNKEEIISMIIFLIALVALICPVYSFENGLGVSPILFTCMNGRNISYKYRVISSWIVAALLFVLASLPNLINILQAYGTHGIHAPVQSLEAYTYLPVKISILQYLVILYVVRFILVEIIVLLLLSISLFSKNIMRALLLGTGILVVPMTLRLLSIETFRYILFNPFITVYELFIGVNSTSKSLLIVNVVFVLGVTVFIIANAYKKVATGKK